jgi:hypothetical protein
MASNKSAAERLFPDAAAAPGQAAEEPGSHDSETPSSVPTPRRKRDPADVLFGGTPAELSGVHGSDTARSASTPRRRSPADVLFGEAVLRDDDVLTDNYGRLAEIGMTREQQQEVQAMFGQLREDLSLSQDEARTLHTVLTDADVKDPQAWETEAQTWPRKTRTMLRERFGDDAEEVLTAVQDYIGTHPPLGTYLQDGLEMNPKLVEILAERVRAPWRYAQGRPPDGDRTG